MKVSKLYIKFFILFFFSSMGITWAQLTPKEDISQMTKGINIENTFEGPHEGDWGNPPDQEYYFDLYKTVSISGTNFRISTQSIHTKVYVVHLISGNQKFSIILLFNKL